MLPNDLLKGTFPPKVCVSVPGDVVVPINCRLVSYRMRSHPVSTYCILRIFF
jgi:hypothetical protein